MFLLPSPPRLSKRHRLENILLLDPAVHRAPAAGAGICAAFMRQAPINDPTAGQPKRMVVLVDTSASMRARRRLGGGAGQDGRGAASGRPGGSDCGIPF
jgi:hypothetical protein